MSSNPIRVAIVGVGNCAASLVQGVHYYREAYHLATIPGVMHVEFGKYHVNDVQFVAAFDVDGKKVGVYLADAILASENNTIKLGRGSAYRCDGAARASPCTGWAGTTWRPLS